VLQLVALAVANELPRIAKTLLLGTGNLLPDSPDEELRVIEQVARALLGLAGEDLRNAFDLV